MTKRIDIRRLAMLEAHKQYKIMAPCGWSWGRSLSYAWGLVKRRQEAAHTARLQPMRRIGFEHASH